MGIFNWKSKSDKNQNVAEKHFHQGLNYIGERKYGKAIKEFQEALRINPNYVMARISLAGAYIDEEEFDLAIKECKEALRIEPSNITVRFNLAKAYMNKGELDSAIKENQEILRIDPNLAQAYLNLGNAYKEQMKPKEAIECLEKFISLVRHQHVPSAIRQAEEKIQQLREMI